MSTYNARWRHLRLSYGCRQILSEVRLVRLYARTVANGPVGPAFGRTNNRAENLKKNILIIYLLAGFGRNNNGAGNLFDILFGTETT